MLNTLYDKILFYHDGKRYFEDADSYKASGLSLDENVHFSINPQPQGKTLVSFQDAAYTYPNGQTVLDAINLTIHAGEFILIN